MKGVEVSVVVPCYNEAKNLPELVARLRRVFERKQLSGEIVLVNDGSRDDTGEVIRGLERAHPGVVGRHHERNRGMEAGWNTGVAAARGEYVCFMDADLQYLPEDVWRLYREIRLTRADLVQGCRGSLGRPKDSRYILSQGLNLLLNGAFGMSLRDNKSGFLIGLRGTIAHVLQHRLRYRYFQSLVTVSARAKGYTIREVETVFESRLLGESFIPRFPLKVVAGCLLDVAVGLVEFRLRRGDAGPMRAFLETHPPPRLSAESRRPRSLALFARGAARGLGLLRRTQWSYAAALTELQESRLQRLVHHLYHHVGYYREAFDARGLKPSDVGSLDDLRKLPLMGRGELRDNLHFDLLADNFDKRRLTRVASCGPAGDPAAVYLEPRQLELRRAARERAREWAAGAAGARAVRLWHAEAAGTRGGVPARERAQAWLDRVWLLPSDRLDDAAARGLEGLLRSYTPALLEGDAESLLFFARHPLLQEARGNLGLRGVSATDQSLSEDERQALESAFGARVFEACTTPELGVVAAACDAQAGLHVSAETLIVELVGADGQRVAPGQTGELVVTDLDAFAMPLVRYRLGLRARALDAGDVCLCGRGLPRVGRVEGRPPRLLRAPGGYVPAAFPASVLKDYGYLIRGFDLLDGPDGLKLLLRPAPRFDRAALEPALRALRAHLGRLEVEIEA